jgi:4-carboxymuconolactone decarboxylase
MLTNLTLNTEMKVNISAIAIKNHEELWPNYQSKAAQTDPELIEIFDNWAFDEVVSHGNIDTQTRTMMIMGSCIAQGALTEYKMFVNAALNVGVSPIQVKEILYQSVAYVGVAKVIDFLYSTNEIFTDRSIELPLEKQSTVSPENRYTKGMELMKETFGERI